MNVGIMHIRAAEATHDLFEICADRSYLTFIFMLEAELHRGQPGSLSAVHGQMGQTVPLWGISLVAYGHSHQVKVASLNSAVR